MRASELDFNTIKNFLAHEWPEGVLEHMEADVIRVLQSIRFAAGYPVIPSPVPGAHVRHSYSGSRHSTKNGTRLSDATDFYCEWPHAQRVWHTILGHPGVGGAGIYTDMMLRGTEGDACMFHIDLRPTRVVWVAWRQDRNSPMNYVYDKAEQQRILQERGKL